MTSDLLFALLLRFCLRVFPGLVVGSTLKVTRELAVVRWEDFRGGMYGRLMRRGWEDWEDLFVGWKGRVELWLLIQRRAEH